MKHIIITGIDKSGKTSVIKNLTLATNGNNYIYPRCPSTIYFFNKLENREPNKKYDKLYHKSIHKMRDIVDLSVLLYANESDIKERFLEHKEQNLIGNLTITEHMKQIEKYFDECKWHNAIKINTSNYTIDETVDIIMENIK